MSGTGKFISFEGGEGCGKTTQLKLLAETLTVKGISLIATRELGGTPGAEALRPVMQSGDADRWDAVSEALIVYAGRHDHTVRKIKPTLAAGQWVLSDRYFDSSWVYQGYAAGQPIENLKTIQNIAIGDFKPDLTLVFDIDVETGLKRAMHDANQRVLAFIEENTRFERKGHEFHQRVREGFLTILQDNPDRCVRIDAAGSIAEVRARVWQVVRERFAL